jgi:carboxyl-terminal processing protease
MKGDVAVIRITQFGGDTVDLMNQAAEQINQKKVSGIILDLRNNPGGYLDTAVQVSSFFIKDGLIVSEEYKDGKKDEFKAKGNAKLSGKPLVVLINEGSASASEIVAGAIQDHQAGKVIGKTSFGKGSVQDLEDFPDGSGLRLTVAKWLTPSGRYINEQGIKPDIEVDLTAQDEQLGRDPQLDRAIKELK